MHKKATCWKSTPFPLYDEVLYLVHGIFATGAGAFHPGLTPEPPSTPSSPRTVLDNVSSKVAQSLSVSLGSISHDEISNVISDTQVSLV